MFPYVKKKTQKDEWGTQKRGYVGISIKGRTKIKVDINREIIEETGGIM